MESSLRKHLKAIGSKGGTATKNKYPDHFIKMNQIRWSKRKRAKAK